MDIISIEILFLKSKKFMKKISNFVAQYQVKFSSDRYIAEAC